MSRQLVQTLVLLVAALAGSLLAAELAVRAVSPEAADAGDRRGLATYDSLLGWRNRPNAVDTVRAAEFEVIETTNGRGLRGPEHPHEKPDGVYRILLLGDSFAEGYTVAFDDLCSEELKRALDERGDRRYEVINGGTAGYSTDQELLFFLSEGRRYEPDLVVLLFYVNDVWYNSQTRYWRGFKPRFTLSDTGLVLTNFPVPPPDPDRYAFEVPGGSGLVRGVRQADAWLGRRSALYGLLRNSVKAAPALQALTIRLGLAEVPGEFRPWRRLEDPELADAWRLTEALLVRLRAAVVAGGGQLLVFHVPTRPAVDSTDWRRTRRAYAMRDGDWAPDHEALVLEEICRRHDVDCVFPLPHFREAAGRLSREGRPLYFTRDGHWTADGHRLAGRLMAEYIARTYLDAEGG